MWSPTLESRVNIAEQLVSILARDIDEGRLPAHTQLPTHRELAEELGVAIGTITRAYALAKQQGLVTGTTGRGMFVAGAAQDQVSGPIDLSQNFVQRDIRDSSIRKALAGFGDPGKLAPLLDRDQTPSGSERHRAAAARWIGRPEFEVSAEQVVICSGAQHAMFIAVAVLTKPGDTILTEQFTYAGFKAIASLLHVQVRGVQVDAEGLRPDAFAEACTGGAKFLYTIPTLQNPTGSVMPESRRRAIAEIARKFDVTILEDDIYSFLLRQPPPPISAYARERCYFLSSTSKSIAPGLRIGYITCPPGAQQQMAAAVRTTVWETSPLMADLMTNWIDDGTAERVVKWKRDEIEARHALALDLLGRFNPLCISPSCHLWIPLPSPWRSDDFVAQCRVRGAVVSPADAFSVGREPAPHAIRVCLGSQGSRHNLERGLRTVAELLGSPPPSGFTLT